jgi:hypothetical protein
MTPNGPYMINQSAINKVDGSGVNAPGETPFTGQVFSNPNAGSISTLQRRMFSGPWGFYLDAALQKTVPIVEGQSLEIRIQGQNILNHPVFYPGDQNINSPTFGVVNFSGTSRIMQFALRYRF